MDGPRRLPVLRPEDLTPEQVHNLVWDTLSNGTFGPPTRVQRGVMWAGTQSPSNRVVCCCFRGAGKSTTGPAINVYEWLKNPNTLVTVASGSGTKADQYAFQTFQLLEQMPECAHLKPSKSKRAKSNAFDLFGVNNEQSNSLLSIGVMGTMTGQRSDRQLLDDIEVPNTCDTPHMREKLRHRVREFERLLRPEGLNKSLVLGTMHSEDSIYPWLVEEYGYTMYLWPALYPNPEDEYYRYRLHPWLRKDLDEDPSLEGQTTDPTRHSTEFFEDKRAKDPMGFLMQYMLDVRVADEDRYPLKLRDFMVMDLDGSEGPAHLIYSSNPQFRDEELERFNVGRHGDHFYNPSNLDSVKTAPYVDKALVVDPSGSGKDETAWAAVGWVNGYLCVFEIDGNTDGYGDDTLDQIIQCCKRWGISKIVAEENYASGMFNSVLAKHIRDSRSQIYVEGLRSTGQKEQRIISNLEPLMRQHRVVINRDIPERDYRKNNTESTRYYRAMMQVSRITHERGVLKHDDKVDALAMAAQYFTDSFQIDSQLVEQQAQREEMEQQIRDMTWTRPGHAPNPVRFKGAKSRVFGNVPPRRRRRRWRS